jgi:Meiotically up-regulated gene 113
VREEILNEIRRLTKVNGGKPPGRRLFERETGIPESAWFGVYWPRWGDAVSEAGFVPNTRNEKLDEEFVLGKLADACRHYGRIPATMELRLYKKIDPEFPNEKTFLANFGGKKNLIRRLGEWAINNRGPDIVAMMPDHSIAPERTHTGRPKEGIVYLICSGAHFKIGRSDDIERRVKEIRIALPETAKLVHSIRTDDPSGIEAYWHRRFADRRANGEWFKLTASDVAAFKRRKTQ